MSARKILLDRVSSTINWTSLGGLESQANFYDGKTLQYRFGGWQEEEIDSDWLNKIKQVAKVRLNALYVWIIWLVSPVYLINKPKKFIKTFNLDSELVADFGSGASAYKDKVVCIDGANYPNVHLVADLQALPLKDSILDGIISIAVLEHVLEPERHVKEFERVLKPGGRVLCFVPFLQAFHASPYDYQRFTENGLRHLFRNFEIVTTEVGSGPTSAFVWILQEWLATVFSFGSITLYKILLPLTWIISPLKFLDLILIRFPSSHISACGYFIEARKKEMS